MAVLVLLSASAPARIVRIDLLLRPLHRCLRHGLILVCAGDLRHLLPLDMVLHADMHQQTDGVLLNGCAHLVEHLIAGQLILHLRVALRIGLRADALLQLCHVVDVIHPLLIDHTKQADALQLADCFLIRELRFLRLVELHRLFLELLLDSVLGLVSQSVARNFFQRNDRQKQLIEFCEVLVVQFSRLADRRVDRVLDDIRDHLVDGLAHGLPIQHAPSLRVDNLTLFIVHRIVVEQILADAKIIGFDLLLCRLDRSRQRLVRDLLSLRDAQAIEHADHPLRAEESHQIVLEGDEELGFARIALSSGTSAQLVVNTAGLMALCADNVQSACRSRLIVQLDIGASASHVGCDGYRAVPPGLRDNACLELMVFCIQNVVRNALFLQHPGNFLGSLDRDRADQHRLPLVVAGLDLGDDGGELLLLRLEDRVLMIDTDDRLVRRDLHDIHAVDLAELLLLGERSTRHTALLVKFIEEILERDGRKRLGLLLDLDMLLRLNRLVQSVGIPPPRHHTSREFIDDENLIVLDDIIVIPVHQIVGTQRQNDTVLDLQILRIREVRKMEELLHLGDALRREVHDLVLLVHQEVSGLLLLDAHDGVDLGQVLDILAALHLLCQNVAGFVDFGGFSALAGNDERRSRLIDQNTIHLVDDAVVELAENQLLFVDCHVVTQVIKSELIVRHIGDVTGIGRAPLVAVHLIQNHAAGQAHELIRLPHPFAVTLCQIVVDSDDHRAASFQSIEIGRQRRHKRFSFAGLHLGDSSLMKNDAADDLHLKRLHAERSAVALPHRRIGLRQNVVQRLPLLQPLPEFLGLAAEFLIRECGHLIAECEHLIHDRPDSLQLMITVCAENFVDNPCHAENSLPVADGTTAPYLRDVPEAAFPHISL